MTHQPHNFSSIFDAEEDASPSYPKDPALKEQVARVYSVVAKTARLASDDRLIVTGQEFVAKAAAISNKQKVRPFRK